MKITGITTQQKDKNRVNVMVDGKYRFSLDIFQVGDLGIKVGREYSEKELDRLETESQFGKLYTLTLEYCLMRPHSSREIRDYLYRKTLSKKVKSRQTGKVKDKPGVSSAVTNRVFERLTEKGYIDDEKFARFWIENRHRRKGASLRKLRAELAAKGVEKNIVEKCIDESDRNETNELRKVIEKKRNKYDNEQKLITYLARQGFSYDSIKQVLNEEGD
jgi:regulatory protein